jgi:hypothetical protein
MKRPQSKNEKAGKTFLKQIRDVELCMRLDDTAANYERLEGIKLEALRNLNEISELCPGEAHDPSVGGNIDNCGLCLHGPSWGRRYK